VQFYLNVGRWHFRAQSTVDQPEPEVDEAPSSDPEPEHPRPTHPVGFVPNAPTPGAEDED